ncbi:MAG: DUF4232 domain-containing protein [Acidimicrobiales bacterium]
MASAASTPHCGAHNDIAARFVGPNGAGGEFYFLIAFTNNGAITCSMSGVPHSQPVDGTSKRPVGPSSTYQPIEGVSRGSVVLRARGGVAYVEYFIVNEANFDHGRCEPANANGVELQPFGTENFYIPSSRRGATEVCTKVASTMVGALSSRRY